MESEKKRFTMISTGTAAEAIDLELDPFIQHGHLIELAGNTQQGARVMVNGSEMPIVNSDGQLLRYFNAALAAGRSRGYGHGADGAERCEEAAEKDCDSVRKRAQRAMIAVETPRAVAGSPASRGGVKAPASG